MSQIATIEKRNGVAIVWLDQQHEKINKVSLEFVEEIDKNKGKMKMYYVS